MDESNPESIDVAETEVVEAAKSSSSRSRRIYCFSCHRPEYHANALRSTRLHHLLAGMTFGLAYLFGPYRCRCCGYVRYCRYNFLNVRYYFHRAKFGKKVRRSVRELSATQPEAVSSFEPGVNERFDDGHASPTEETSGHRAPHQDGPVGLERHDAEVTQAVPASAPAGGTSTVERTHERRRRRRKRNLTLKAVPRVDTIGKERKEKQKLDEYSGEAQQIVDYSVEGLMGTFETTESRKVKKPEPEKPREPKVTFEAKKVSSSRSKKRGKRRRRSAKRVKLTGPKLLCFTCSQTQEHFNVAKSTGYYPFFIGISLGLVALVGPFRCSICSKRRFSRLNFLHPKYYFKSLR